MAQAYGLYHGTTTGTNQLTNANLALARGSQTRTGVVRGSGTGGTAGLAGSVVVNGVGLVLNVNTLDWWYAGYFAQSTGGQVVLTLAANPAGSIRIDRIVAQIDTAASTATIVVVQGTAGAGAPAINTLNTQLQLSLAQVSVAAGATAATNLVQGNVTDERSTRAVCGYAAPLLHASEHQVGASDPLLFPPPSLSWPETLPFGPVGAAGAAGTAIVDLGLTALANSIAYTVPANYNLYVTHLYSAGTANTSWGVKQTAGGNTFYTAFNFVPATISTVALPVPLIVQSGGGIEPVGGGGSFRGVLIPVSSKLVGIGAQVTNAVTYTVPAGLWFVLCHINNNTGLTAMLADNSTNPIITNPGLTTGGAYVGAGGAGALLYGMNVVDTNGLFVAGVTAPMLWSPGMVFKSTSANALQLHGYTWPQTG